MGSSVIRLNLLTTDQWKDGRPLLLHFIVLMKHFLVDSQVVLCSYPADAPTFSTGEVIKTQSRQLQTVLQFISIQPTLDQVITWSKIFTLFTSIISLYLNPSTASMCSACSAVQDIIEDLLPFHHIIVEFGPDTTKQAIYYLPYIICPHSPKLYAG